MGTASIAVASGASADQTVAALLHAAYFQGDFGDGRIGVTDEKRAEVRGVVGPGAEQLVHDYGAWPWRERLAALQLDGVGALRGDELPLAHLRIANEIEDCVDLAVQYVPDRAPWVWPLTDSAACARALDLSRLAEIADAVAAANEGRVVPAGLRSTTVAAEHVPPRSLRPNLSVRVRGGAVRVRRIVGRIPGASGVRDWLRNSTRSRHRK